MTEQKWRNAIAREAEFGILGMPSFVGRAVTYLAIDSAVNRYNSASLSSGELAKVYHFTDPMGHSRVHRAISSMYVKAVKFESLSCLSTNRSQANNITKYTGQSGRALVRYRLHSRAIQPAMSFLRGRLVGPAQMCTVRPAGDHSRNRAGALSPDQR